MGEAQRELRHRRGVGAAVVVEDDDHPFAGVAQVVERLVGHAPGEGAVADDGHHPAVAALQLEGGGHAVGVAEDGRGVAVLDPVVLRLGAARVAGEPVLLAEVGEGVAAAGDQLVDVGLVAGVPQQQVAGRVEGPVQGQGELDDAEVGAEVTTGGGDGVDDELPDLPRQQSSSSGVSARRSAGLSMCSRIMSAGGLRRSGYQRTTTGQGPVAGLPARRDGSADVGKEGVPVHDDPHQLAGGDQPAALGHREVNTRRRPSIRSSVASAHTVARRRPAPGGRTGAAWPPTCRSRGGGPRGPGSSPPRTGR